MPNHINLASIQVHSGIMKVTIKTLKNEQFEVEVDGSKTVKDAKEVIAAAKNFAVAGMKLIYAGVKATDVFSMV